MIAQRTFMVDVSNCGKKVEIAYFPTLELADAYMETWKGKPGWSMIAAVEGVFINITDFTHQAKWNVTQNPLDDSEAYKNGNP